MFGFSKLDVMFGHADPTSVHALREVLKPGVRFRQETITAIDRGARVTTNMGVYEADHLVVALGAEYDFAATPGLSDVNEFYSVAGAAKVRDVLPGFNRGRVLIGVCGAPFKCPPAPSECALMLHDYLEQRGVRQACEISMVLPLSSPVPPSPETSKALLAAFAERNIAFQAAKRIAAIDAKRGVATLDDGVEMPFDLFLGVSIAYRKSCWIAVGAGGLDSGEAAYAGDAFEAAHAVATVNTGTPKAGVFAERAAKAVASALIAKVRGGTATEYDGFGTCYIEFGGGRIGKVEVDFFSGPKPTGTYHEPSTELRADKEEFGSSRRARWFGM
jgi:sulfide:quinone oxidoreductase